MEIFKCTQKERVKCNETPHWANLRVNNIDAILLSEPFTSLKKFFGFSNLTNFRRWIKFAYELQFLSL